MINIRFRMRTRSPLTSSMHLSYRQAHTENLGYMCPLNVMSLPAHRSTVSSTIGQTV